jgi:hypothetical protein
LAIAQVSDWPTANAQTKLRTLNMYPKTFSEYWAEFSRYRFDSGLDEASLMMDLRIGLSDELSNSLANILDAPEDLTSMITACQKLENNLNTFGRKERSKPAYKKSPS